METPPKTSGLTQGAFIVGKVVGESEMRSGMSKSGKPYTLVTTNIIAGTRFVRATQSVQAGQTPKIYHNGEDVTLTILPAMTDNGTLVVNVG